MSDRQKINIYMMGSQLSVKGGMSSVIRQMLCHDWGDDMEIRYMATHMAGSAVRKALLFAKSYLYLLWLLAFQRKAIDIFYLHMSYKGSFVRKYLIYKLANAFGKDVIVHLHGSEFKRYYDKSKSRRQKRIRELFEGSKGVVVLGNYWRQVIHEIAPEAQIKVVLNAVALPEQLACWNEEHVQLLYMGVLIPRKGVKDLLNAMKILDGRGIVSSKNIKLVIGGNGNDMTGLQEQCHKLHLDSCVEFAGWIDGEKKEQLFKNSQCLILPSYNEGLPVAVLEALSYGLPVVSTNVGSICEAVREGVNGHLVKEHAPEQIADAVEDIISDRLKWSVYSRQARHTAEQDFDEMVFFEKIKTFIFHLVKEEEKYECTNQCDYSHL